MSTMRFNFPYIERGRRSPDPERVLRETWLAAFEAATERGAAGRPRGGSRSAAASPRCARPTGCRRRAGVPRLPCTRRARPRSCAEHLERIRVPMLFLQGTRDPFANPDLLKQVLARLGDRAVLEPVEGGDHSFRIRGVRPTIARSARRWPPPRHLRPAGRRGALMPRRNRRAPTRDTARTHAGVGGTGLGERSGHRGAAADERQALSMPRMRPRDPAGHVALRRRPRRPGRRRHWHERCWQVELNRTRGRRPGAERRSAPAIIPVPPPPVRRCITSHRSGWAGSAVARSGGAPGTAA